MLNSQGSLDARPIDLVFLPFNKPLQARVGTGYRVRYCFSTMRRQVRESDAKLHDHADAQCAGQGLALERTIS